MRFDRAFILCLLLALPLAGCVTTQTNSSELGKNIPKTSKAEQARDAARIHTELGQRYMERGDLQTALQKLQLALKFDPDYANAHTVIAVLYEKIDNLPLAEANYRKAVELEPKRGAPNNNLGQFLCSRGNYAEGETYFRRAVADPFYETPDVALNNAGVCAIKAGNNAAAEVDFRDAVKRNPTNAEALFQLASVLYRENKAFPARAFIQRFDALGHATPASLKLGHDIENRLGNPEGALSYSKRLQSQFPDSEQAQAMNSSKSP